MTPTRPAYFSDFVQIVSPGSSWLQIFLLFSRWETKKRSAKPIFELGIKLLTTVGKLKMDEPVLLVENRSRHARVGEQVEEMAEVCASVEEIAAILGLTSNSVQQKHAFQLRRGRATALCKLRAAQWRVALEGNIPMLIWLGKQYLGQRDVQSAKKAQREDIAAANEAVISLAEARKLEPDELRRRLRAALREPDEAE